MSKQKETGNGNSIVIHCILIFFFSRSFFSRLSLSHCLSIQKLQVWFQNARAKWRRSVLRQQSMGPHVVEESQPLSELPSSLVSSNHQRDTDSSHLNSHLTLDSSFIPTSPVNGVNNCNNSGNNNGSNDSNPTGASCRYSGHGSMMISSAHHHAVAHQENQENPFFDGSSRVVKSADSPLEMIHEEANFSFLNMIRPLHMFWDDSSFLPFLSVDRVDM